MLRQVICISLAVHYSSNLGLSFETLSLESKSTPLLTYTPYRQNTAQHDKPLRTQQSSLTKD